MDSLKSTFTNILTLIKKLLANRRTYIYGFIVIVLLIAGYKIYKKTIKQNKYVNNKEYKNKNEKEATLFFFETQWCPYCKKTKPIWNDLINEVGTKKINDVKLNFITIDCDASPDLAEQYKVESYPTIILQNKDQKITYDANVNITTLRKFLNSTL